jgi:hypothetical protein
MNPVPSDTNPDAVAWYVDNASALLADEHRRGESLQTRAGQLAGFAGVSLALLGSLLPDAFGGLELSEERLAGGAYLLALALLIATIVLAVVRVLKPVRYAAIDAREVREYVTDRFLVADRWEVQVRTLRALAMAVASAQSNNETKAKWLGRCVVVFLAGLVASAGCLATLGLEAVWG